MREVNLELDKMNNRGYLIKLTIPIFIELLLQMLVGNIDQFMISRYSQISVAAIGNSNQIINLLTIAFSVLCTATVTLISQYRGAQERTKEKTVYTVSIITNLVISIAISLIIVLFNKEMFSIMNVPKEILGEARVYITITGGFIFLQSVFMTFSAFLRSNTLMREGMVISIMVNLLNVIGNAILINGLFGLPALGITGVAISTALSRLIGVIIIVYVFYKRVPIKLSFKYLRPFPVKQWKTLLSIGIPTGFESLSYSSSQICILSFINLFGTESINAKVYVSMFATVSYIYAIAISSASQVIVGRFMGAKRYDDTNKTVMYTLKTSIIVSLIFSVVMYMFSDTLLGIFTTNQEIIALGKAALFVDIFLEMGRAVNIVLVRALQTAGDIKFPIMLTVFFAWVVAVGGGYILGVNFEMGLVGIWIAMASDEIIRGFIFYYRWQTGKWKSKNLID